MIAIISKSNAFGEVYAPPSKSVCHRALICAALSGKSVIENVSFSEDIKATLSGLKALGSKYEISEDKITFFSFTPKTYAEIDCRESGSTLRFLIPVAAALCDGARFYGSEYLFSRPLNVYEDIFDRCGIEYEHNKSEFKVKGKLSGGDFFLPGDVSSQFVSGLLLASPLLYSDTTINITSKLQSAPYVNITLDVLAKFGITFNALDNRYEIINRKFTPCNMVIEGDYSNASALDSFNIVNEGVSVKGLNPASFQGDKIYIDYLEKIKSSNPTLDITDCPDLAPVLMSAASLSNGAKFIGTNRLKLKESDRGEAMKQELQKFGCDVKIFDNEITVGTISHPPNDILCSHNDHRIVMALSLLASVTGGKIENAEAVNKSFPDYFDKIKQLGIKVDLV